MIILLLPVFGNRMNFCVAKLKWFWLNLWQIGRARVARLERPISIRYQLFIEASGSNLNET